MHKLSKEMRDCINACLACYASCLGTSMMHCLEQGGKHVEPEHFRLMMACAEICRVSAHFMLIGTEHHKHTYAPKSVQNARKAASNWTACRSAWIYAGVARRPAGKWQDNYRLVAPPSRRAVAHKWRRYLRPFVRRPPTASPRASPANPPPRERIGSGPSHPGVKRLGISP